DVAAAVDEHDDRKVLALGRGPEDVQRQAVLRADRLLQAVTDVEPVVRAAGCRAEHPSFLDAAVTEVLGVPDTWPRPVSDRCPPAELSDRWFGVRNAAPCVRAGRLAFVRTGHEAERGGTDDRRVVCISGQCRGRRTDENES